MALIEILCRLMHATSRNLLAWWERLQQVLKPTTSMDDDDDGDGFAWQHGDAATKGAPSRTLALPGGVTVTVSQAGQSDRAALWANGGAGVVWEAAEATCRYLCSSFGGGRLEGKRVVECGAGTGIVGIACAALGAKRVTLTDLPSALELLRANAASAACADAIEVLPLVWGETAGISDGEGGSIRPRPHLAVACDCLYQREHYAPLAATLAALGAATTIVTWRRRDRGEDEFVRLLGDAGLTAERV